MKASFGPWRFASTQTTYLVLADVDTVWAEVIGDRPILKQFMDDRIAALYRTEQQQGQIFELFEGLAILVSYIGLYGLVSFSVERRKKEIGMRKILGATRIIIARQILWDFSKPILIANLIAWPISAYLMSSWLTGFNYRIELSVGSFLWGAGIALAVTGLTVCSHAIRVASANPIFVLREE